MRTLFKNTERELRITEVGNRITVDTLQDIENKELKKEQTRFIKHTAFLILTSFFLGVCVTYSIMT